MGKDKSIESDKSPKVLKILRKKSVSNAAWVKWMMNFRNLHYFMISNSDLVGGKWIGLRAKM